MLSNYQNADSKSVEGWEIDALFIKFPLKMRCKIIFHSRLHLSMRYTLWSERKFKILLFVFS